MYSVLCPICQFVNPADATRCKACNAAFFEASGPGELDEETGATLAQRRGLRSLSETAFDVIRASPEPRAPARRPARWSVQTPTRRSAPSASEGGLPAMPAISPAPQPVSLVLQLIDPLDPAAQISVSDQWADESPRAIPSITWPSLLPGEPGAASDEEPTAREADNLPDEEQPEQVRPEGDRTGLPERRVVAKALARQAARRARMSSLMAEDDAPPPADVLLLDRDDSSRESLAALLGRFGFVVHQARDLADAERLESMGPFAAAFLDVSLDGDEQGASLALCRRLRSALPRPGLSTAVVLMSQNVRPMDRVRAALARSDIMLAKPLSRGDVARTLESCGVVMPADERRH